MKTKSEVAQKVFYRTLKVRRLVDKYDASGYNAQQLNETLSEARALVKYLETTSFNLDRESQVFNPDGFVPQN
jgi:hypothetical protein